jgi:predicted transcriptional regulator
MSATSLKLPEDLKRRIQALVADTELTPHAFMVAAIARETERAELRRRFGEEAREAEEQAVRSGKVYDAEDVFKHLKAKAGGKTTRRPRPKAWRRSS